jgi:hypothetical protein
MVFLHLLLCLHTILLYDGMIAYAKVHTHLRHTHDLPTVGEGEKRLVHELLQQCFKLRS